MKRLPRVVVLTGWLACVCLVGCSTPTKRVKAKTAHTVKQTVKTESPCIVGRLVKEEDGKPLSYVPVETKPATALVVSRKDGSFEICHRRVGGKGDQESKRLPIPLGKYFLIVKKENYKTKPLAFVYNGKSTRLGKVELRSGDVPLPDVVVPSKPSPNDKTKDRGIIGRAPRDE
ncbi:MAG: hypothetical protein EP343_31660 [Deltaproteobacteria bacterium]|nr:MAG: hypothetical protein EP343_31660 [Deltaproteobacteria bacterium]